MIPADDARATTPTTRLRDALTLGVCWAAWLSATVVAVVCVHRFAQRFPFADDWYMCVPVLNGRQPLTLAWLWSQHNEHRIFIPRLAFVALGRHDGGDFRAPVLLNVAAIAAIAGAFLVAARRRRGRASLSDCFFVCALLHVLQSSFMWGAQFQFVSSTLFFSLILFVVLFCARLTAGALAVIALATLALPLCGGNGLTLVPPIAVCLIVLGLRRLRSREFPTAAIALGGGIGSLALAGFYFVGWHSIAHPWGKPTLRAAAGVTVHMLAAGLGPDFARFWPLGGIIVTVSLAATAIALAYAVRRERYDGRAFPLLALVGSLALLALSIGYGRGGRGWEFYLEYHYAPLALPMLCIVYLASIDYAPKHIGPVLRWSLFALAAYVYFNALPAWAGANPHVDEMNAFAADLQRGLPAHELVVKHMALLESNDVPKEEREYIEQNLARLLANGYYRSSVPR